MFSVDTCGAAVSVVKLGDRILVDKDDGAGPDQYGRHPYSGDTTCMATPKKDSSTGTLPFETLFRNYRSKIYRLAFRMVRNHEQACDIVQETFIKAYGGLKKFRGESSHFTWLYRIAVNQCLKSLRKERLARLLPFKDELAFPPQHGQSPRHLLEREEKSRWLQDAIDRLPPRQKSIVVLRNYHDMTYQDIAAVMNRSVGTIKAAYFHALKNLASLMKRGKNNEMP